MTVYPTVSVSVVVPRMKSTLWVFAALLCSRMTRATPGSVTVRPAVVALIARISTACCILAVVTVIFPAVTLASKVAVRALCSRISAAVAVTSYRGRIGDTQAPYVTLGERTAEVAPLP